MMEDLICEICFLEFDNEVVVPKVVECGHSFCIQCLTQILKTSKKCPKCMITLAKDNVSNYPTNYSFISLLLCCKTVVGLREQMKKDLKVVRARITASNKAILKSITIHNDYLNFLEHALEQITEIENQNIHEIDVKEAISVMIDVKKVLCKIENFVHLNSSVSPTMNFKDFEDAEEYLYTIYQKVEKGENIFSVHYVENRIVYGKVSVWSNMLMFHNLCLSEIEYQELIKFEDVKKCLSSFRFRPYLKITCNERDLQHTVMIDVEKSPLTSQFIKLCTGEVGATYKGASFCKGEDKDYCSSIMQVYKYISNDNEAIGEIDYALASQNTTAYPASKTVVVASLSGGFQIYHSNSKYSFNNSVGIIENPSNLKDLISYDKAACLKIVDSGVSFSM